MKRRELYYYILGLLVSCFVNVASAQTAKPSCSQLFVSSIVSPDSVISSYQNDYDNPSFYSSAKDYSLDLEAIYDGRFYLMKKKPGMPWFSSTYSEVGHANALQGDPRWNFEVFGPKTLSYLRITAYGTDKIVYPSIETLNVYIQKLNTKLEELGYEKIPVQFYTQQSGKMKDYLENFADGMKLPIANPATSPMHYVHDLSFHLGSVLVPKSYFKFLQDRVSFVNDFIEYLEKKFEQKPEYYILKYIKKMRETMTVDVDVATAGVNVFTAQNYGRIIVTAKGLSPSTHSSLQQATELFLGSEDRESNILNSYTQADYSALRMELFEFIYDEKAESRYDDYMKPKDFETLNSPMRFLFHLQRRRAEIEEAATALEL